MKKQTRTNNMAANLKIRFTTASIKKYALIPNSKMLTNQNVSSLSLFIELLYTCPKLERYTIYQYIHIYFILKNILLHATKKSGTLDFHVISMFSRYQVVLRWDFVVQRVGWTLRVSKLTQAVGNLPVNLTPSKEWEWEYRSGIVTI